MKSILPVFLAAAVAVTFAFAEENKPVNPSNEVAVIKTSEGEMVVQFWNDAAPETIAQAIGAASLSVPFWCSREPSNNPGKRYATMSIK